jgi:hypothetical protein
MRNSASGTIMTGTVVNIDHESPVRFWPLELWCVTRAARSNYFEARRWDHDHVTREYHESIVRLLAHGIASARQLVPRGFVVVRDEGTDGEWYRRDGERGATPRVAMPSMPIKTLGSAA